MTLGFVMLVHESLERAAQVARHWAGHGCPVVIHVDRRVPQAAHADFARRVQELDRVVLSPRYRCDWGRWSLVQASQVAAELMLRRFPQVRHVFLASGSCLPLRPVSELIDYLGERPTTDFIESVTVQDVPWTVGGLDIERFTLRFPFSWKRHRSLFDRYVRLQRRLGISRHIPDGIVPHLGSQWWCLTRQTLAAILSDPRRPEFDRYFRRVWIPDESYYQTLVRRHSTEIESRSLTLAKFDFQGKPHVFYDDHLQLLRRSDCFVARKIWPRADRLYRAFLSEDGQAVTEAEPNPGKIDRIFAGAVERRTRGRPGLYMQSRFPHQGWENGKTCAAYSVCEGFADLFDGFEAWLARVSGACVHGHLFAPDRAHFAGGQPIYAGGLSDSPRLRDYNPTAFLTNLIWNTRGEHQGFQFGPRDAQAISAFMAADPNARISVISGAWAVGLFRTGAAAAEVRDEAARLQQIEARHLQLLRASATRARVRIWTLADFIDAPMTPLQAVLDEIEPRRLTRLAEAPTLVDLAGFDGFLRDLRNLGMLPHLAGNFPTGAEPSRDADPPFRPYAVGGGR